VLTPTGWEQSTRSAGQEDLRGADRNGNFSVLILLEATSTTVKEQFLEANADAVKHDNTDHRVTTKDGAPLSVDVYRRVCYGSFKMPGSYECGRAHEVFYFGAVEYQIGEVQARS